jgi:hypothetical protein
MKKNLLIILGAIAGLIVVASAGIYAYNNSVEKAACTS